MGNTTASVVAHTVNGVETITSPVVKGTKAVASRLGSFKNKVSLTRESIKADRTQRRTIKAAMKDGLSKIAASLEDETNEEPVKPAPKAKATASK